MRTRLALTASALIAFAVSGCATTSNPAASATAGDQVAIVDSAEYVTLPACDSDAPDPSLTIPCVWEDEDAYWVMDGLGHSTWYVQCPTEDSTRCVFDSSAQGNHSSDVDAPGRFVVNA